MTTLRDKYAAILWHNTLTEVPSMVELNKFWAIVEDGFDFIHSIANRAYYETDHNNTKCKCDSCNAVLVARKIVSRLEEDMECAGHLVSPDETSSQFRVTEDGCRFS